VADHEEVVFEIDRAALKDYRFLIEGFYFTQVIDGFWEVGFQVPERMDSMMRQVDTEIKIGGKTVRVASVEISPLGLTIKMQVPYQVKGEFNISLIYQDGSVATVNEGEVNTLLYGTDSFTFTLPLHDFKSIDSLDINGVIIDF
jgi:hypothetical protein